MTTGSYAGDAIILIGWTVGFIAVLAGLEACATVYEWVRGKFHK